VYLPKVEAQPDTILPSPVRAASLKGTETILLVEDDEPLRKLTLSILRHDGYHVLAASSREEAIQLGGQHQGPIHLMLTDVVMPGRSVREFVEQLASTRPAMKVLHMSGYTDDTVVRHGVLEQSMAFLQKPFTTHSLLRKVREVLDASQNRG
jgi:DNA-binding NtrC family response regulator